MNNILSISGIVVSILGVVISLLLFNASVDNGRKIIINRVLRSLNREVLWAFTNGNLSEKNEKKYKERDKCNYALGTIHHDLHEIRYASFGVPVVDINSQIQLKTGEWESSIRLSDVFNAIDEYFMRRHIDGLTLMLEYYDDRLLLCQHYEEKRKYIRKFKVGPIIGVKINYKRREKTVRYRDASVKLIKRIASYEDYKKYYEQCYLKFDNIIPNEKKLFERSINDVVLTADDQSQYPIVLYV